MSKLTATLQEVLTTTNITDPEKIVDEVTDRLLAESEEAHAIAGDEALAYWIKSHI